MNPQKIIYFHFTYFQEQLNSLEVKNPKKGHFQEFPITKLRLLQSLMIVTFSYFCKCQFLGDSHFLGTQRFRSEYIFILPVVVYRQLGDLPLVGFGSWETGSKNLTLFQKFFSFPNSDIFEKKKCHYLGKCHYFGCHY